VLEAEAFRTLHTQGAHPLWRRPQLPFNFDNLASPVPSRIPLSRLGPFGLQTHSRTKKIAALESPHHLAGAVYFAIRPLLF
jgi:hypothetical protein